MVKPVAPTAARVRYAAPKPLTAYWRPPHMSGERHAANAIPSCAADIRRRASDRAGVVRDHQGSERDEAADAVEVLSLAAQALERAVRRGAGLICH